VLNNVLMAKPVLVLIEVIRLLVTAFPELMKSVNPADVLVSCPVMAVLNVDKVV
jgi:hypothetical protein